MTKSLFALDESGRMAGLTDEETAEFRRLDDSLPYGGEHVWPPESAPLLPIEVRWLELWERHRADEMATNKPEGDDARKGAVEKRAQLKNPPTKTSTKRNKNGGQFMAAKKTAKNFKGVWREKAA